MRQNRHVRYEAPEPDIAVAGMIAGDPARSISAILPNRNHGRYLPEAVRALATQDPAPTEIIVVDDASTDDSVAVLERLSNEVPQLRIIREERNRGALAALNRGLAEAEGAFVYFGAADDVTLPGLFAHMLAALDRHPDAAFATGEAVITDLAGTLMGVRPPVRPSQAEAFFAPEQTVALLRRADNWILTGAAVFRRELVTAAGGFDIGIGSFADGFLTRRLALRHGFVYVPVMGLNWRVSPAGLSRSAASGADAARRTIATMLAHVAADPVFPRWYAPLLERRWRFGVGRIAVESRPIQLGPLRDFCARNGFDRGIYRLAAALWYPAGATLALVWLTLRERPTSLTGLLATAIMRRVEAVRSKLSAS